MKLMRCLSAILCGLALNLQALAKIPDITLSNGETIPAMGCGTWEVTPDETAKMVGNSIKNGIMMFDTAQYYRNEGAVGKAIATSGVDRSEVFVVSKLRPGKSHPSDIREALDRSLDLLGGTIDLMLIHWPYQGDVTAWTVMEEYVRAGKFRMIGLSNYTRDDILRIMRVATIKPVVNQVECNPYRPNFEILEANRSFGLTTMAWSPLGAGKTRLLYEPVLQEIAQRHDATAAQVVMRWEYQHGVVIIPRTKSVVHQRENPHCYEFKLSAGEMAQIDALSREDGRPKQGAQDGLNPR